MKKFFSSNFIFFIFLLLSFSLIIISSSKKTEKEKIDPSINHKITISSILDWAKTNYIYINPSISLNLNKSKKHFYYFTSNTDIPEKTLLLKIPYDSLLSQNLFSSYVHRNKKFSNLWEQVLLEREYVRFFPSKQLFYMSVLIENAVNKKKGNIYKKFYDYLRMYENLDLFMFPIFYDGAEKGFLADSNFGRYLIRVEKSFSDEFYLLNKILKINTPLQDEFNKYRFLSLANSIGFKNENLQLPGGFNETVIIPFIDCFNKVISDSKANAYYEVNGINKTDLNNNNKTEVEYFFEVYSTKKIEKNSEINLKWKEHSNTDLLIYFGFAEEGNKMKPPFHIEIFNKQFKKDLEVDDEKIYQMTKKSYELNLEFNSTAVINAYKTLIVKIPKYSGREEGPYEMMYDNLKYFYNNYEKLSDGNINKYINNQENVKYIKEIIHLEKEILEDKMNKLRDYIEYIKNKPKVINKENKEDKKNEKENNNKNDTNVNVNINKNEEGKTDL